MFLKVTNIAFQFSDSSKEMDCLYRIKAISLRMCFFKKLITYGFLKWFGNDI